MIFSRICNLSLFFGLLLLAVQPTQAQRLFEGSVKHLKDVERMYTKGLEWLASKQQPNGTFSGGGARDHYGSQPGVVGLAVVSMLAHGDDPNFGKYAKNITNGGAESIFGRIARNNGRKPVTLLAWGPGALT